MLFRSSGTGLYSQVMSATPTQASTGLTTWLNQGTATVADTAIGLTMSDTAIPTAYHGLVTASVPATPYKLRALLATSSNSNDYKNIGLGWRNSASGFIEYIFLSIGANSSANFVVQQSTAINAYYANIQFSYYSDYPTLPIWYEIADDGTNVSYSISMDGTNFTTIWKAAKAGSFLGATGYNQFLWFNYMTGVTGGNAGSQFAVTPSYNSILSWTLS